MSEEKTSYILPKIPFIKGLKEAINEEKWNDCVCLLKKNIGLNRVEVKQLQYVKEYKNLMDVAFQKGFKDLIMLLIHNGYPINKVNCYEKINNIEFYPLLLLSLKYNLHECTILLLEKNVNVNCTGINGETPLDLCVEKCLPDMMDELISYGANITARDKSGNTILHRAVLRRQYDIVKFLLDKDIDTDVGDNIGNTALHHSIVMGFEEIFSLLYEGGASINSRNNNNETPLIMAVKKHHTSMVEHLLKDPFCDRDVKFAYYNGPVKRGVSAHANMTALSLATLLKYLDIVELFQKYT